MFLRILRHLHESEEQCGLVLPHADGGVVGEVETGQPNCDNVRDFGQLATSEALPSYAK